MQLAGRDFFFLMFCLNSVCRKCVRYPTAVAEVSHGHKIWKARGGTRVVEKYKLLLSSFRRTQVNDCSFASCLVPSSTLGQKGWVEWGKEPLPCAGGGPCSLEGGWGSYTPSTVLTSCNLCRFAPRHMGVSSVTARFLYFSKANKLAWFSTCQAWRETHS